MLDICKHANLSAVCDHGIRGEIFWCEDCGALSQPQIFEGGRSVTPSRWSIPRRRVFASEQSPLPRMARCVDCGTSGLEWGARPSENASELCPNSRCKPCHYKHCGSTDVPVFRSKP